MSFIIKFVLIWIALGIVITIFEKVTGIKITKDESDKMEEVFQEPSLESELREIERRSIVPSDFDAAEIAKYVVESYEEPFVRLQDFGLFADVKTIASKIAENQLYFSEKYEGCVIVFSEKVETIQKSAASEIYLTFGDGHYYSGNGSHNDFIVQNMECWLDENDMEDDGYKELVLSMKQGDEVVVVGVLGSYKYRRMNLLKAKLIKVGQKIPKRTMNLVTNEIYKKYRAEN